MANEFPTAWHRTRYIEDVEKEIAALEQRASQLEGLQDSSHAAAEVAASIKAAKAELARAKKTTAPKDDEPAVEPESDEKTKD